jgi:hypothetical protein
MNKSKIKLIGISGNATSGKDSLFDSINSILSDYKIESSRLALADPLKYELDSFTRSSYGISSFTKDPKEKNIIRPLMVAHGKIKRSQTNGTYFTKLAQNILDSNAKDNIITICTDVRYFQYNEDEFYWLKQNDGVLVYIERVNSDGSIIIPANNDELENNSKLKFVADFNLRWPTTDDLNLRKDCVLKQLNGLIQLITNDRQ